MMMDPKGAILYAVFELFDMSLYLTCFILCESKKHFFWSNVSVFAVPTYPRGDSNESVSYE